MERDPLHLIGTTIDKKYVVEEVVGEGGFSVVYRAQHLVWQQPVALKCFKVALQANDEQRQQLFEGFVQEGKLMTELSTRTSAIVQARDIGTVTREDGSWVPYMVLEWLDGEPLDEALAASADAAQPGRTIESCVTMLNPAAEALAIAHRRKIVHRDIKPANLFVVYGAELGEEVVKILDFGVAKVMQEHLEHDKALQHTTAKLTAFTPTYGAPEQFSRSYGATGPWTDVFALALVMVELLLGGQEALQGTELLDLARASTDETVRPTPRTHGLAVSDEVEAVFQRALAVQPGDRYPSMGEFWSAMRSAVFPGERRWTPPVIGSDSLSISVGGRRRDSSQGAPVPLGKTEVASPTQPLAAGAVTGRDEGGPSTTSPTHTSTPAAPAPRSTLLSAAIGGGIVAVVALVAGVVLLRAPANGEADGADSAAAALPVAAPSGTASAATSAKPTCPDGMVYVPGGKFFMGSDETKYPRWLPAHQVELAPYCLDVHEVTAGEYKDCSDVGECKRPQTTSRWPKPKSQPEAEHARKERIYSELCTFSKEGREQHPINCVQWEDADRYCRVRGKRLPTEAQWEFAARGSDGRSFPWGDEDPTHEHLNACGTECNAWEQAQGLKPGPKMVDADDGFPGTAPVGSFPKGVTMFGVHDMVGNVFEWTADWMGPYSNDALRDPTGPAHGEARVIRGGAFNGGFSLWVNPAFRYAMDPMAHSHGIGFRCASEPSTAGG